MDEKDKNDLKGFAKMAKLAVAEFVMLTVRKYIKNKLDIDQKVNEKNDNYQWQSDINEIKDTLNDLNKYARFLAELNKQMLIKSVEVLTTIDGNNEGKKPLDLAKMVIDFAKEEAGL
jgi:hypothetical protein